MVISLTVVQSHLSKITQVFWASFQTSKALNRVGSVTDVNFLTGRWLSDLKADELPFIDGIWLQLGAVWLDIL